MMRIIGIILIGIFLCCNCKSAETSHPGPGHKVSPELLWKFPGFNPVFAKEEKEWVDIFYHIFDPSEKDEMVFKRLKGPKGLKTKTVSEYEFPTSYEKVLKYKEIHKYDNRGNEIETNYYMEPELFEITNWSFKYDDRDNMIEFAFYKFTSPPTKLPARSLYKYDNKGNRIEMVRYNHNGDFDGKGLYKYDDRGRPIEKTFYDENDRLEGKRLFKYDDGSNRVNEIKWTCYDADGKLADYYRLFKCEYDNKGRCESVLYGVYRDGKLTGDKAFFKYDDKSRLESVLYEEYNDGGLTREKFFFKYDDKGRLTESINYYYRSSWDDEKFIGKHLYKYNNRDNHIETTFYDRNNKFAGKHLYKYDDRGNQIEKTYYSADDKLSSKTLYKYDDRGNLIEGIEYEIKERSGKIEEIPVSQTVYEYEYYPEPAKK